MLALIRLLPSSSPREPEEEEREEQEEEKEEEEEEKEDEEDEDEEATDDDELDAVGCGGIVSPPFFAASTAPAKKGVERMKLRNESVISVV